MYSTSKEVGGRTVFCLPCKEILECRGSVRGVGGGSGGLNSFSKTQILITFNSGYIPPSLNIHNGVSGWAI